MNYKVKNTVTGEETICEKVVVDNHDYYLSENPKLDDYCYNPRTKEFFKVLDTTMIDGLNKNNDDYTVIATTNKSLDLPMVIDEVEELAENHARSMWGIYYDDIDEDCNETRGNNTINDYKAGYDKAKETYSYTKEDMVEFADKVRAMVMSGYLGYDDIRTEEEMLDIWQDQRTIEILVK